MNIRGPRGQAVRRFPTHPSSDVYAVRQEAQACAMRPATPLLFDQMPAAGASRRQGTASAGAPNVQPAKVEGIDEELVRARERVLQLERELRQAHEALERAKPGAEASARRAPALKSVGEGSESLAARVIAEHTVAFERARATAAEASARKAVDAALRFKSERDAAREALRACQLQLFEAENALKRR